MIEKEFVSQNVEATKDFARMIGENLWDGSCVLLSGDLGAGKTCFTQGLGEGMAITQRINSPTFTILKIYRQGRLPLFHLDAYRLEGGFQDVGFSEFIGIEGVTVIEWPDFIEPLLPKEYLKLVFQITNENERLITVQAIGDKYEELLRRCVC